MVLIDLFIGIRVKWKIINFPFFSSKSQDCVYVDRIKVLKFGTITVKEKIPCEEFISNWFDFILKGTNVDEISFGRCSKGSWTAEEESRRLANEIPINSWKNH